jgi:hypothetical protein
MATLALHFKMNRWSFVKTASLGQESGGLAVLELQRSVHCVAKSKDATRRGLEDFRSLTKIRSFSLYPSSSGLINPPE